MRDMNEEKTKVTAVVVNDHPAQLNVLCALLRKAEIEPLPFLGVEAALSAMDPESPPNLIVTDLYMPGIDGWRFCHLLRSLEYPAFNKIPILIVSATFAGDHPERIAKDAKADAFLPVPVNGKEFIALVQALLSGNFTRRLPRVLIVEDDVAQVRLLNQVLINHGYQVDITYTIREAVEAFEKTSYDVAVIDYYLPDGTGDILLDAFHAKRPTSMDRTEKTECACVLISGDMSPERALDWMRRGAAAYLHKPFSPETLVELCVRARRERTLLRAEDLLEVRTRELRESESRYRGLFAVTPDGMWIHATDGTILDANETLCLRIGLPRTTLIGRNIREFIPARNVTGADASMPNIPDDCPRVFEAICHSTTGTHVAVEIHEVCIPWQGNPAVLSIARDITARKQAEKEKEDLQSQFLQVQKMESIGRLAGGVAHDFNNMLQAIIGHTELALERVTPNDPLREDLEQIRTSAWHSAALTGQLLAFARKQTIAPKALDLNETIADILKILQRLIGENINLVWNPGTKLENVLADPSQVNQILTNLCVNARDAIEKEGKITIETDNVVLDERYCAQHAGTAPGKYVRLTVSDTGCGMDAETLSHLFEPFFTTKARGKGTGLGLATVYGIVKQNKGFITVDSALNRGSTFAIHLPRHAAKAAPKPEQIPLPTLTAHGETILLVEDEVIILKSVAHMLSELGYTTLAAATPGEAIRLAQEHSGKIDLLITDVIMPEMNGRELARTLLATYPDLKLLFMSGYTSDIIAQHGVLNEGVHFIQKPFSKALLTAKMSEILK